MKLWKPYVLGAVLAASSVLPSCGGARHPAPPSPPPPSPAAPPSLAPPPTPIPTPTPTPTDAGVAYPPAAACEMPTSCPPLRRWGISTDPHMQDANKQPVKAPVVGGTVHWDTTPRFGDRGNDGQPCNEEHHLPCESPCGAWRHCEDPRGADFRIAGPAEIKAVEGFGIRVKVTGRGKITLTACPRKDAKDAYGVPLQTSQDACSSRFVTVR